MKKYRSEIGFGLAMASIFAGLLIWYLLRKPQELLFIVIGILIILLGIVSFSWRVLKKKRDLELGTPAEDEFTKKSKVFAGNQAFEYSMYLWMLIFVFNSSFDKPETMLGVGILGSALIYGLCVWYFRATGGSYEE